MKSTFFCLTIILMLSLCEWSGEQNISEMDYLTSKWKLWFHSLDVNHDGKISKIEDVEEFTNTFTDLHQLIGEHATGVKVDMETWWKLYIFKASSDGELSETQFVQYLTDFYNKDEEAFTEEIRACFNMIFGVIDTTKDRSIELDEFIYAFKAFGHENERLIRKAFGLLEPKFGLVPLHDIVNAWVSFVSSPDISKPDAIKQAFDAGF